MGGPLNAHGIMSNSIKMGLILLRWTFDLQPKKTNLPGDKRENGGETEGILAAFNSQAFQSHIIKPPILFNPKSWA